MRTVKKKAAPKKKTQTMVAKPVEGLRLLPAQLPVQQSPIEQMKQMQEMGISVADMKDMLALQRD